MPISSSIQSGLRKWAALQSCSPVWTECNVALQCEQKATLLSSADWDPAASHELTTCCKLSSYHRIFIKAKKKDEKKLQNWWMSCYLIDGQQMAPSSVAFEIPLKQIDSHLKEITWPGNKFYNLQHKRISGLWGRDKYTKVRIRKSEICKVRPESEVNMHLLMDPRIYS